MMPEKYQEYLFEYYHNGAKWSLRIPALSGDDARARLVQIQWARLLGTVQCKIPAKTGLVTKAISAIRNALMF